MDTLGKSDADLCASIEAAARRALHDWGRPMDDLDDLVQDVWTWYLARPSIKRFIGKAETETGRRNALYRGAVQILSENQASDNVFRGDDLYSSDAIKTWLKGESTNKYVGKLITNALEGVSEPHQEAIRARYEGHAVPVRGSAEEAKLKRAVKALTESVNAAAKAEKQGEATTERPSQASGPRRGVGGYSDPTAEVALGLMAGGDNVIELHDGTTTTYRKEFEDADNIFATRYDQPTPPWAGVDLFEGELNDRTDMYRAQVFPELYPNEKPMLIGNWPQEDLEAYCGGVYTPGYRRLKVVK